METSAAMARELLEGHFLYKENDSDKSVIMKARIAIVEFPDIESHLIKAARCFEEFIDKQTRGEETEDKALIKEAQMRRLECWDHRREARRLFNSALRTNSPGTPI